MITMYPSADKTLIDENAEKAMETLQGVIKRDSQFTLGIQRAAKACKWRSRCRPNPKRWVPIENEESLVKLMARVSELRRTAPGDAPAGTVVAVSGEIQVAVHLAGQIDVAAETQRIARDLQKADKERTQINGRLGNVSFVERAPAAVVEKERARLAELDERIVTLGRSQERLKSLS